MLSIVLVAAAVGSMQIPPVPGLCTEPALENVGQPGCYMAAEITIPAAPAQIYWSAYTFPAAEAAAAAVKGHMWSVVTRSHGLYWAHILGRQPMALRTGKRMAMVGPMVLAPGKPIRARFIEANFPPGMRTPVHSHPGPEGFYVLDGIQCMETPSIKRRATAGQTMIVPARTPHFQSTPQGRRNVAVLFYPPDEPWMRMEMGWQPTSFCNPPPKGN
ncbi:MAG: cupin domain-containing protein [Novosphingobium sp.]